MIGLTAPDATTLGLLGAVLCVLGLATAAGRLLKRQTSLGLSAATVAQFQLRVRAWWLLFAILAAAILLGQSVTVVLFGLLSFWALREFITLTPTRPADHRTLFWVFVFFTPLQFVLVGLQDRWRQFDTYTLYTVLIPVYAFLFIPARVALAGDFRRYLERCAKIQAALMICVYCLSHAPALLYLQIPGSPDQNVRLLFFLLLVVSFGDALQYASDKLLGRRPIAPAISPTRTWEGFLGGVGGGTLLGTALWWATPFSPAEAGTLALAATILGFAGGMTMSAIKRDRGVADYGTLVEGHGGVLDRIDSVCFAAPVYYHLARFFLGL